MAWHCVALLLVIAALKSPHHPATLIANIPIPTLFYSWVGMVIGLIPVVAIETLAVWIGLRGSGTDVLTAVSVVSTIPLDGVYPMSMAFTPDGTCLALGCNDGFVRFWDIASGMLTRTIDTDVHTFSKSVRFRT